VFAVRAMAYLVGIGVATMEKEAQPSRRLRRAAA
jgi:hypothetical protein